jgi:hypothetical protein
VDLVVIATEPERFREAAWVRQVALGEIGALVTGWEDRQYGILWSRHLTLDSGLIVEVGFAPPEWAAIDPCDDGTRRVIEDGCWIILDPTGLLNRLVGAVRSTSRT